MSETLHRMSMIEHFHELRKRILFSFFAFIVASGFCYLQVSHIYSFLVQPLHAIYNNEFDHRLIFTGLTEAFFAHMKLACFAGFILTFPIFALQFYFFIAPGLYKRERRLLIPYLVTAPLLFLLGAALVYYYIMPFAWRFFASFEQLNSAMPLMLEARISEYLALVMSLIVAFGLAFQLPLVLMLLAQIGIVKGSWLASVRRYAIVIIFIVAAILTPPDVLSQITLAVPLMLLYEISVLICKKIEKAKVAEENARH